MTDVFDDLDRITMAAIGDPIDYTPTGGALASIKAWVDHSGDTISFGFTEGITANVVIQVNKTDVPTATKQDLIYLPRTGLSYNPTEILTDRSGRMWNMALGRVATV